MSIKSWGGSLLVSLLLVAGCGGGGGGGSTGGNANTNGTPEGVYAGTLENTLVHNTFILDDARIYSIYGEMSGDVFMVGGLLQGNGTANNGNFSSTNLREYSGDGSVVPWSLSASYQAGKSFSGALSDGMMSISFSGTAITPDAYNYNAAANLSNITGSWNLDSVPGAPVAMTIQSNGIFSATSGGCSFSGMVTPRASGKNVFDVTLTYGAAPCILAGQSANGIAIEYPIGIQRQLIIATTTLGRDNGAVLLGAR